MSELSIVCRTCSSQRQREYLVAKDLNQEKSDESFVYYLCNNCGSIFLHPVPFNLAFFYGQDYPAYSVNNSPEHEANLDYYEHAKLEIVQRYVRSGKLIEVGPASGRFLSLASHAGYEVLGIEQDAGCVAHIRKVHKLNVKYSDDPATELSQQAYACDVIVAWHVIEHLQDLRAFVCAASNVLRKSSGMIIVSAPNPKAWSFKIFGRYWLHLDAPRHLNLIPLQALDELMANYGLEKVAHCFDDTVGLLLNEMGWCGSLINLSRNKKLRQPWLARLGRILSIVMRVFDRVPGRGAAYTVVYKIKGLAT